jgi:cytochrome c553
MKILLILAMLFALGLLSAADIWADDAVAGQPKSLACSPCHGKNGIGKSPQYPNLAGQKKAYLVKALKAYRSQARNVLVMIPIVRDLTDEDIAALAAHFEGLPCTGQTTLSAPTQ